MRKKSILIVLLILAFGLIGIGLSTLYRQNESIVELPIFTFKESHGFPRGWYGYSWTKNMGNWGVPPRVYWFSLESLLLDAGFWFAISFFVCLAAVKSATTVMKATSKILSVINIAVMYFSASLSFLVVGLCLSSVTQTIGGGIVNSNGISIPSLPFVSHPYLDVGLRLFGFGIFLVVATFYQSLVRERKIAQKHFLTIR
jgi:hypothetical protein